MKENLLVSNALMIKLYIFYSCIFQRLFASKCLLFQSHSISEKSIDLLFPFVLIILLPLWSFS